LANTNTHNTAGGSRTAPSMVTRAALDLPCPINPPVNEVRPGQFDGDDVPALRDAEGFAGEVVGLAVREERVGRGEAFGGAGVGDPEVDVAGVSGGGGPHLQRCAQQVAGQDVAFVGDHLGVTPIGRENTVC